MIDICKKGRECVASKMTNLFNTVPEELKEKLESMLQLRENLKGCSEADARKKITDETRAELPEDENDFDWCFIGGVEALVTEWKAHKLQD